MKMSFISISQLLVVQTSLLVFELVFVSFDAVLNIKISSLGSSKSYWTHKLVYLLLLMPLVL